MALCRVSVLVYSVHIIPLRLSYSGPHIPNAKYPGNVVLLVTRGDETKVYAAKRPSFDMLEESSHSVWLYPHGSHKHAKRLADCANKILHGEKDEKPEHVAKRIDLQKFCSGLEFSSLPKPAQTLFDQSKLSLQQRRALERIERGCSDDQRKALHEIYSCNSFINMVQGPPGTGKTHFAANILIPILAIFGLKANCYASSDVATDVLAGKIPEKFKALRFHGVNKEWHDLRPYDDVDEPTPETPAQDAAAETPPQEEAPLSKDEIACSQIYQEVLSFVPAKRKRPHIGSLNLYVRALQRAKVMDDNWQISATVPDGVPQEYQQWAQYYYKLAKEPLKADNEDDKNDDSFATFKRLTLELFEDTLKDANFVITTCSNAADKTLRRSTQPIVVIVDEAGVAKELETLMAIYYNLNSVVMVIIIGDHLQLPPIVLTHLRKLVADDSASLPYNIFAPQMCMSLMARQIQNGHRYTMFTTQYRMTAGIEELSSRMCYNGRLENDRSTLLVNRHPSQDAVDFIQNQFGLKTTVPHVFLNVYNGVCIKGRTMSRHNPPNVIVVMFVIQSVLEAGLFRGDEICVITPYREQVSRIRTAIAKAGANNESLRNRGILSVRVHTIDSMQGGEANMVIVDLVLAKRRSGRYGFLTNRGRINVGVTRARFFQVLIGDCNAIDAPKAKEAKDQDQVPDTVVSDEEDEAFVKDVGPWESNLKHIRLLYQHYQEKGVVVDMDYEDKPQSVYVDLTAAKAFLEEFDAGR